MEQDKQSYIAHNEARQTNEEPTGKGWKTSREEGVDGDRPGQD